MPPKNAALRLREDASEEDISSADSVETLLDEQEAERIENSSDEEPVHRERRPSRPVLHEQARTVGQNDNVWVYDAPEPRPIVAAKAPRGLQPRQARPLAQPPEPSESDSHRSDSVEEAAAQESEAEEAEPEEIAPVTSPQSERVS